MDKATLRDSLDGLFAYDQGSVDSGIRDEDLRARCHAELLAMPPVELRVLPRSMYGSAAARAQGYTDDDVTEFREWLINRMGALVETDSQ